MRIGTAALGLVALVGCSPAGLLNGVSRLSGDGATRLAKGRHFARMMIEGETALRRVAGDRLAACRPNLTEVDRRALATVLAAGFLAMLRDWLEQGRPVTTDEVARRFEAVEERLRG